MSENERMTKEELEAYYGVDTEEDNAFDRAKDCVNGNYPNYEKKGVNSDEPTDKTRMALLDYAEDPFQKKQDIADRWGIDVKHLYKSIQVYRDWLNKENMRIFESKKGAALRKMEELAVSDKNFKALEFILRAQGVNPEKRVTIDETDINVSLTKEDK